MAAHENQNDTEALRQRFVAAVNESQNIVHKVCSIYCKNRDDHEDLFQEILVQLWVSYPKFRGEAKFSTWMYRVALNTAISSYRKGKRTPTKDGISIEDFQIADTPARDEVYEEQRMLLMAAIERLNKIEKAIIFLYLEEKDYEEISDIVGITQNYVRVKMNRIKNKIKKLLIKR